MQINPPPAPQPIEHDSTRAFLESRLGHQEWLFSKGFVLENWQWLGILLLIALGVVLGRIATSLFFRLARRFNRSRGITVEETGQRHFVRPFGLLVMAWCFVTLLPVLEISRRSKTAADILGIAASSVLTFACVWAALRFVDVVADFLKAKALKSDNKFDDMLVPLLRRTLKIFVVVVGTVYLASKLTEEVWTILAGLSLGSVAIGFAARDSVENLFGTFTVLLDKPFQLGDWITVGSVDGTVERVGIRSTRIRTFYNSLITVPNRSFIAANVDNWGARRYRRIKTTLGLAYDTPPEKIEAFCEGVREILRTHPYTRKDYFHVYLNEFSASSLDVMLYAFVEVPDWSMELRERHRLFADILRLAERLKVDFAFPTQTLHMAKPEDLVHPDRPASDADGAQRGREVARAVTAESLARYEGRKPPPVSFD